MKKLLFLVSILLLFLPSIVTAQWPGTEGVGGGIRAVFVDIFGFPEEWLTPSQFIYYGIMPFLGIWLIIYGFLSVIKIFGNKTNLYLLLAFFIAFSTLPLRVFTFIVSTIFAFMGVWSVIIFVAIFVIGSGLLFYRRIFHAKGTVGLIKDIRNEIKDIDTRLNELRTDYKTADPAKKPDLLDKMAKLRKKKTDLIDSLTGVTAI